MLKHDMPNLYKHFRPSEDQLTYFIAVFVKEGHFGGTPEGKRHTRSQKYTPSGRYPSWLEDFPKKRESKEIKKKSEKNDKVQ